MEDLDHGQRCAFGGLDDHSVATCQGVGQIPERNHAGEVEGTNRGDHADGLADHVFVNAVSDILRKIAQQQVRNTTRDLDILDGAAHLPARVIQHFAVFERDAARQVLEVLFQQSLEFEQVLNALHGRRLSPSPEGALCCLSCLRDLLRRRERRAR
ncbi:MAG: hypothetical protein BWY63_03887 [Chloroflexi bacterium ADurb.Bin360]|nr:MAG: hypothetical protein BWY63_03887 [Chloroflexi bacterium ADurb.Bin360]